MADVSHAALVNAFEARYDYLAARTVLNDALKNSGVGEKKSYSPDDIGKLHAALEAAGERNLDKITKALGGPAPAAATAAPAAPEPKAEEKPAPPAPEPKADDKKDEKAEAKADDKADDKKGKKGK